MQMDELCVRACQMKGHPSEGRLWLRPFSGPDDNVCQCSKKNTKQKKNLPQSMCGHV